MSRLKHRFSFLKNFSPGWMDGCKSRFKDSLQKLKIIKRKRERERERVCVHDKNKDPPMATLTKEQFNHTPIKGCCVELNKNICFNSKIAQLRISP